MASLALSVPEPLVTPMCPANEPMPGDGGEAPRTVPATSPGATASTTPGGLDAAKAASKPAEPSGRLPCGRDERTRSFAAWGMPVPPQVPPAVASTMGVGAASGGSLGYGHDGHAAPGTPDRRLAQPQPDPGESRPHAPQPQPHAGAGPDAFAGPDAGANTRPRPPLGCSPRAQQHPWASERPVFAMPMEEGGQRTAGRLRDHLEQAGLCRATCPFPGGAYETLRF